MVMCNDLGLLFSFGSVFPYILEEFQESRASTTAIQSIFFGVGQGSGVLSIYLLAPIAQWLERPLRER